MTGDRSEQPNGYQPPLDYPADAGLPPPVYPYPGYPPAYPAYYPHGPVYPPMKPAGTNGKAIAALVTSVAGMACCGLPSIVGLVLGLVAMSETKRSGQDGYGLAVAAVAVGTLVVLGYALYVVVAALLSGNT